MDSGVVRISFLRLKINYLKKRNEVGKKMPEWKQPFKIGIAVAVYNNFDNIISPDQ